MQKTVEIILTPLIEMHLNRNPCVVSYQDAPYDPDVTLVTIDDSVDVPAYLRHEMHQLGLYDFYGNRLGSRVEPE